MAMFNSCVKLPGANMKDKPQPQVNHLACDTSQTNTVILPLNHLQDLLQSTSSLAKIPNFANKIHINPPFARQ